MQVFKGERDTSTFRKAQNASLIWTVDCFLDYDIEQKNVSRLQKTPKNNALVFKTGNLGLSTKVKSTV